MKSILFGIMATAAMLNAALAAPPLKCLVVCVEPSLHDPNAAATCNCAERYCPVPEGPGGPNIPAGDVWGWNESTNSCGPVPEGDQCAGLDVTCADGFAYGWNGVDTCQCLPDPTKRQTGQLCRIQCVLPSVYDPNAVPTTCNCAKEYCPPPQGPGGPEIPAGETWAYDAAIDACGPVSSPQAECLSLDVECVANYTYGWYGASSSCQCLPDYFHKQ